jgi:hypothetical protein
MNIRHLCLVAALALASLNAGPVFFSTGNPDGLIGTASRPSSGGKTEIESADDFVLGSQTSILSGTFTGLLVGSVAPPTVDQVLVEIYRVFPKDSDTGRSIHVPTRVNSPSDVAFNSRDSSAGTLVFTTNVLNPTFTAANSVLNGINPFPNQKTLGEGPVTGQEVQFNFTFVTPMLLPGDHYFFIPQVDVNGGEFYWLSAPKPIVPPGTPFAPDLQSWIRNEGLAPDWLRVGTDIVGSGAFNAAFSLNGEEVPEPGTAVLLACGLAVIAASRRIR